MKYRMLMVAAVVGLFAVPTMGTADEPKNNADTYQLLDLFGDVFERVRSDYVEEATDQKMIESAINGMLTALDPHSSYLNAKNFREMQVQTRGEFGGLGIRVTMEGGLVKVISPIDDTPAFRAGIEPGDFVTHLDGEAVLGLTLAQAVDKMRGRIDTDIRLMIRRKDRDPFEVVITRAVIKVQSVRSRTEGNVGYIRITSFNQQTDTGLKKAVDKLKKELGDKIQGVVLDLRNNPGGLLNQAISVSDDFLERGEIVSTRSRRPEDTQRFNARPGDIIDGVALVVLINGGSASASEIVAGALQDHRRAIVLGTKSFGKGSVQTIIPLPGHGAMRLTTARYYTPAGRSIQAVGIEPDIAVEQARIEPLDKGKGRRESELRGALKNENGEKDDKAKKTETKPDGDDKKAEKPQDYQLSRALDLLRGLSLFSGSMKTSQR